MTIHDSVLENSEKIIVALRQLYRSCGYQSYRMSKFEEYDLYAGNKDFLVSDNVITFTDTDGKLMALKPDVTLSIIKNSADEPEQTRKVYYNENVYRVSKGTGSFKEIMQSGVECFGRVEAGEVCEMLTLAARSLRMFAEDAVLAVSDLEILSQVTARLSLTGEAQSRLYQAIGEKNTGEIARLCADCDDRASAELLQKLLSVRASAGEAVSQLDALLTGEFADAWSRFRGILQAAAESEYGGMFRVDFSLIGDINYYNGVIFKGFLRDVPTEVLSGGQYDKLMRKLGRKACAIGFAVYTEMLERLEIGGEQETDPYLNIALPKGRLGEKIYQLFAKAGYDCPSILEPNRKLIFECPETKVRYFWVKPSDVSIYVERGAADIGVVGKDILAEYRPEVYELLDLKKGKCRMAVAAPKGYADDPSRTLRVATSFPNIAKQHYRAMGRDIDIIRLNGSIEIAPILGLSDVIVDIVETGATLRENDLEVVDTFMPISARLIANKAACKFKGRQIEAIRERLARLTEEEA